MTIERQLPRRMDLRGDTTINDYAEHSDNIDSWWVDDDKYPPGYHRHDGPTDYDRIYHVHDGPRDHNHGLGDRYDHDPWQFTVTIYGPAVYPTRSTDGRSDRRRMSRCGCGVPECGGVWEGSKDD